MIFGATGDLAHRKLLPAIYNLAHEGALPERFDADRDGAREMTARGLPERDRGSRSSASRAREPDPEVLDGLLENMRYLSGTFDDAEVYDELQQMRCRSSTTAPGIASQPRLLPLDRAAVLPGDRWRSSAEADLNAVKDAEVRIVIEKPFGYDLASAQKLNRSVLRESSTSRRSSASTTTWARRRSRT